MSDLVRTQLSKTLAIKSLNDMVRAKTSEAVFLLIDVSGSMRTTMRNGKRRIEGLRNVVGDIRQGREVKMIAFGGESDGAYHVSSVPEPTGGTPLHSAIDLARTSEAGRVVVISDGVPDDQSAALDSARTFGGRIDVVFVGNPGEAGERFLKILAESTGGTEFHGDLSELKQLSSAIVGLLEGPKEGA